MYQSWYDRAKTASRRMQSWHSAMKTTAVSRNVFLRVSLRASVLLVRDRMQFPRNEAPGGDFASKWLTSVETYGNIEWHSLGILHGLEKNLMFCPQSKHAYRSQGTGRNIQERWCKPITQPQRILLRIQHRNTIKALATTTHCRMDIQTQPQNRDDEILSMWISISTLESCIKIPDCMMAEEMRLATLDDEHIGILSELYSVADHWPKLTFLPLITGFIFWMWKDSSLMEH